MRTKTCNKCGINKPITEFNKHNATADGYFNACKECILIQNYAWNKSKNGIIYMMYRGQKNASKKRGHKLPFYTKKELQEWLFSQPLFHELYDNWVESNYDRWKKPSVDRLDNTKGYSFDNIQLVTWKNNHENHKNDVKNGIDNRISKAIIQYDLNGNFINRYYSINKAVRETGFDKRSIRKVCKGQQITAYGFKWEYE